ncbi:MAG: hypothetical protein WB816_12815 [Methylocystis sp.]
MTGFEFGGGGLGALGGLGRLEAYVRFDRPVSEDLFILIPGIMGSELYVDGKPVWSPRISAIFDGLTSLGDNLSRLEISGDSADDESLNDGVTVGGLIPDIHIIPGFKKIDGYSGIGKRLVAEFRLRPGKNYFEFAYDWRRDNRATAKRLRKEASQWLKAWRETGPSGDKARLILVGHSMGGLVARYFLEALGGWEDARAFITFGTPYRGSVKALDYVSNGYLKNHESLAKVTELVRSFTSTYQLMPIYDCCSPSPGEKPGILTDAPSIPNVDKARLESALTFHDELRKHAAANNDIEAYSTSRRYAFCPIIGIGQPTPSLAVVTPSGLETIALEDEGAGDGTVPRVSAEAPLPEPIWSGACVHEFHGSLQNNDAAWWQLKGVLERLYLTPDRKYIHLPEGVLKARMNATPLDPDVKLRLRDACAAEQDFQCEVKRAGALKSIVEVGVESVASGKTETRQVTLETADAWRPVNFGKLERGAYRCMARAGQQIPGLIEKSGMVTDVFMVV